jgi:membrane-bound metal-dependent hydrolase YbcI (DUF457 family)
MIAGHFGFAALVKSRANRVPLWSLMLATVWLDIVFVPLLLMKIESLKPVPGLPGGYGQNIIYADYTHSLAGALALSALFGLFFLPRWGRGCAIVVGLVSFSHWLLDLITHRQDMPFLPGNAGQLPRLGFGLWQYPWASATAELLLVITGAWFYWQSAKEVTTERGKGRTRAMRAAALILVCGVLVLTLDVTAAG